MAESRLIGSYPVIGIRLTIDGRRDKIKVRESLEDQTMNMAKSAAKLIEENMFYSNEEHVDLMATPRLNEKQRRIYKTWRGKSDYNYGLGVRVHTAFNGNFETLAALGEFGWDGAAGSYLSIIPKDELSIVYVQHQRMQQGNKKREGLINMLLCALENEGILERN